MSIYGIMQTSVSGMGAQANMLGTVADNIANAGTIGYKRSTQEFSTLVLESGVAGYTSGAVESETRTFNSQQGAFNYTSSTTDLAIRGQGYFVVEGPDGTTLLTRAGAFVPDADGNLVNSAGYRLMAYPADAAASPVSNGYAGLEAVNISSLDLRAEPSTQGRLYTNLPPDGTLVGAANLPSTNTAGAEYTAMTSVVVYDNVGTARTLDVYQTRTGASTWEVAVFERSAAAPGGGFPYASGPLATTTLAFDPSSGALAGTSATSISIPVPNGASMTLDLSGTTELAAAYMVKDAEVNGSAPSSVDHIEISNAGEISAVYKNGSRAVAYVIAMANVASPDNLETRTGNLLAPTASSGDVRVGLAQTEGLGAVVSNALEKSTVDVASELTTMIEAQHSYTANSKVFQTATDLMEVLINLKR